MSAGGGASGEVVLPNYLIQTHANWLGTGKPPLDGTDSGQYDAMWTTVTGHGDFNVPDEMIAAANNNPFTGAASYDPSSDLDEMDTRGDIFMDAVDEIDPTQYLTDAIANALTEVDNNILDPS